MVFIGEIGIRKADRFLVKVKVLRRTRLASWVTVEEILADVFWESLKQSWARVQAVSKKMGTVYVESVPEDMPDIAVPLGLFHTTNVVFGTPWTVMLSLSIPARMFVVPGAR